VREGGLEVGANCHSILRNLSIFHGKTVELERLLFARSAATPRHCLGEEEIGLKRSDLPFSFNWEKKYI